MRRATPRFASLTALIAGALLAAPAIAALPALSAEAKAKAAETAAKTAWTDKVGAYKLCRTQDRVVAHYRQQATEASKAASAAVETPACADPGPFVAPVAPVAIVATTPPAAAGALSPTGTGTGSAAKPATAPPLEAAGAHSPPATATAPPSSKATATDLQGPAKK